MRTIVERRIATERRVAAPACDRLTLDGASCRAVAAWKCTVCDRMLCGMHVARESEAVRCCFCYVMIGPLTPRVADRRKQDRT
jgi:hypothetical protein